MIKQGQSKTLLGYRRGRISGGGHGEKAGLHRICDQNLVSQQKPRKPHQSKTSDNTTET